MARMSIRDQQTTAQAAPRVRPPGDVTSSPTPGTPRGDLLAMLGVSELPPDSRLSDSDVASILSLGPDGAKTKFRDMFCTPPAPFYCEAERTQWLSNNPWCGADSAPTVTVPQFVDEVTRNAWIATHPTCPVPPPVLTDHVCTPGDPSCDPRATPASTGPSVGWLIAGALLVGALWWSNESGRQTGSGRKR